jgi:hypothetical protein
VWDLPGLHVCHFTNYHTKVLCVFAKLHINLEIKHKTIYPSMYGATAHSGPWPAHKKKYLHSSLVILTQNFFMRWGCQFHAQLPTWRTRVSLFIWVISLDLSGMGDPASSYATAGIVPRILWPCKPQHIIVGMPLGRQQRATHSKSVPSLHP